LAKPAVGQKTTAKNLNHLESLSKPLAATMKTLEVKRSFRFLGGQFPMSKEISPYYSRVNPDLLALIPPDAKTVLEIGCGAGALADAYRRINPRVEWNGVDTNKECRDIALTRMTSFDPLDIDVDSDHFVKDCFDCVILGDVLEHLRNPWLVLKNLAASTKCGAQVLACIPNVGHWTVIRDLLNGKWTYTDEGLLDKTHLRFFALDSIQEMFGQAGLQVFEIRGRNICNEGFESWVADSGIKPTKEMRAYQYLARAIKPPAEIKPLHIHAVLAEECCARPRILEPFAMLGTIPGARCTTGPLSDLAYVGDGGICIQQRFRTIDLGWQRNLARRLLLIAELDDEPEAIGVDPMALKAVHAVQVSTEPLAEIVRQWNPNVMVFPNQIAELPPWGDMDSDSNIHIFYGAQNRQDDWKPIMPALNRVLDEYGNRISVIVVHDREFYDALSDKTDKHFFPFCDYARYRGLLRECNIALLPLEPGQFNECKSDLKFLECAAEGVAVLASPTVYGKTVIEPDWRLDRALISSPTEFEVGLRYMINDSGYRGQLAKLAYTYVKNNRLLSQHFRKRLAWYQELLATKPDLDRQLWERVPELAPRDLIGSSA
jgi:SAM-dependent methyltransferase